MMTTPRTGAALARLRMDAGFHSAYSFYHRNGGRKFFPFSWSYYFKAERGMVLPRPAWMRLILRAFRLLPEHRTLESFIEGYLRDLVDDEEFFQAFVRPRLRSLPPAAPVAVRAVKRLVGEQAYHVSPAQFEAVVSSPETYWAFECLVNSRAPLTLPRLAEALRTSVEAVAEAVTRLEAAGLAKTLRGGRARSPLACRFYLFPREYPGFADDRRRLLECLEARSRKSGPPLFDAGVMLRIEEADARRILENIQTAVEAASAFSVYDDGRDSAFYLIETRLRRMMPF